MQREYQVQVDSKGYVLIPSELRKIMGIGPRAVFLLSQEGSEIRLIPGEVVKKRKIRKIPREELAQGLIDGAITDADVADAQEGIRQLGLDPAQFASRF